jgi:hypothetical protein
MSTYVGRALSAYYRGRREGMTTAEAPDIACSVEVHVEGRGYVRLQSPAASLGDSPRLHAVYRIKPDGFLRRLKRWPKAVEGAAGFHTNGHCHE